MALPRCCKFSGLFLQLCLFVYSVISVDDLELHVHVYVSDNSPIGKVIGKAPCGLLGSEISYNVEVTIYFEVNRRCELVVRSDLKSQSGKTFYLSIHKSIRSAAIATIISKFELYIIKSSKSIEFSQIIYKSHIHVLDHEPTHDQLQSIIIISLHLPEKRPYNTFLLDFELKGHLSEYFKVDYDTSYNYNWNNKISNLNATIVAVANKIRFQQNDRYLLVLNVKDLFNNLYGSTTIDIHAVQYNDGHNLSPQSMTKSVKPSKDINVNLVKHVKDDVLKFESQLGDMFNTPHAAENTSSTMFARALNLGKHPHVRHKRQQSTQFEKEVAESSEGILYTFSSTSSGSTFNLLSSTPDVLTVNSDGTVVLKSGEKLDYDADPGARQIIVRAEEKFGATGN